MGNSWEQVQIYAIVPIFPTFCPKRSVLYEYMLAYITVCSVCCLIFLKKRIGMGHLSLKGATVSFFETKDGVLSQIIEGAGFFGTF